MSTVLEISMTQKERNSDKTDSISFLTKADIKKTKDTLFVKYEETELTGLQGNTTVLKVTDDSLTMIRYGKNENKVFFKKGEMYQSMYHTPYGSFTIQIDTKNLDIKNTDGNYSIKLRYMIKIQGLFEGENTIDISVKNN